MSSLAIQGCQWGDEGKGKITDYCASKADVVVRSQGGNNAGHSIVHHGTKYALRLLPSGVFNKNVTNVLADGVAINPWALLEEIDGLKKAGVDGFHLLISNRSPILMPYHIDIDHAREGALGNAKIGTTGRGIGPCYEDLAVRLSLRMGDLLEKDYLHERLLEVLPIKNKTLGAYGLSVYETEDLYQKLLSVGEKLGAYITDTSLFLSESLAAKKKVLFEGAQGAMLCLEHGTYPYVTSSSPLATAIPLNCGLPLNSVSSILGIVKAYTTRVGAGPFPSEIADLSLAQKIRDKGHEYGTVTKRPRRIGWLDAVELRYVARLTGVKKVALMLLDVLGDMDSIQIAVKYTLDGKEIETMPSTVSALSRVQASYESFPSWKGDLSACRHFEELPKEAKDYIAVLEKLTGLEVAMVSVGPDKEQTIIREEVF